MVAGPPVAEAWSNTDRSLPVTLSNGDKTATLASAVFSGARSTQRRSAGSAGKYYAEFVLTNVVGTNFTVGIQVASADRDLTGSAIKAIVSTGNITHGGGPVLATLGAFVTGDVICVAWDAGIERVWFRRNGDLWNNNAAADPATNTGGLSQDMANEPVALQAYFGNTTNNSVTVRTELDEFTQPFPDGFMSWMGESAVAVPTTGTGALNSGAADLDATGKMASFAIGALQGNLSALAGAGSVTTPGAAPWTPVELGTDLIAWYDFSDSATVIQSGGFLTQWRDKSGMLATATQ